MSSGSESTDQIHSALESLINSRNRDLSLFIPFLLGLNSVADSVHGSDHHQTDRIILINPVTQGMVVIEGASLDSLLRKHGPPPASKSSIDEMPRVEIGEGDVGECVICLEEWMVGGVVKEMPCKHRFHGDCIEKWLGLHGSCPVCRHAMPVEEDDGVKKQGEERRGEVWVSFSVRRRPEEEGSVEVVDDRSDSGHQSETAGESETEGGESETGN